MHQRFEDEYSGLGLANTRMAQTRKQRLKANFDGQVESYLEDHPGLLSFYNSVIRPDLP
jgi:hypothetical protein